MASPFSERREESGQGKEGPVVLEKLAGWDWRRG